MNKTGIGIIGAIVVVLLIVLLLGGTKLSCKESFWDKDKQVITIEK
ncbi:MAG: hypothetical protein IPM18_13945 [Phycisphaerales bacterium]|nr:hypothetical protein [Phycisphaerales bacterium]